MRITYSLKNISIGIFSQIILALVGFISRKVFLDNLGVEYLGVNGLLTNVLSMLALIEGGIGISIVYNLYKPLAVEDRERVIALIQLYKKVYTFLALIVLILSVLLFPFIQNLMREDSSISDIVIIYFLFVAKSMLSYLNAHKWSLISADQKSYILTSVNLVFQLVINLTKILVLIITKSYILYLFIELLIYAIQTIVNGRIVDKRYSYIKTKTKYTIDKDTKENIITNVKALFLHNIGGFLVFGTDNLLISFFVGLATVGIYSNYTMIIGQLSALIKPILGGIGASVGNLIATESSEKNYSVFKVTYLVNFWIFSFSVIFLFNLLEPFILWWLGNGLLLEKSVFLFILINFYLDGMRTSIGTFKNKAGLFVQDKYAPIIEGLINLIGSLILIKYLGLLGIFIGTTISTISTVLWIQPVVVYKHIFKMKVSSYFKTYFYYTFLTVVTCIITTLACNYLAKGETFLDLVFKGFICLVIPNTVYLILFYKTKEFQYLKTVILKNIKGVRQKKQYFSGV